MVLLPLLHSPTKPMSDSESAKAKKANIAGVRISPARVRKILDYQYVNKDVYEAVDAMTVVLNTTFDKASDDEKKKFTLPCVSKVTVETISKPKMAPRRVFTVTSCEAGSEASLSMSKADLMLFRKQQNAQKWRFKKGADVALAAVCDAILEVLFSNGMDATVVADK